MNIFNFIRKKKCIPMLLRSSVRTNILSHITLMSLLLYGYTTWTLIKHWPKKLMGSTQQCYMLFWTNPGSSTLQNSSCMVTYLPSHKPSKMSKTCWRNSSTTFSYKLLYSVDQPAKTYIHQLCADTGCCLENLQRAITYVDEQ